MNSGLLTFLAENPDETAKFTTRKIRPFILVVWPRLKSYDWEYLKKREKIRCAITEMQ